MSDTDCTQYWGKREKDTEVHHLLMYHNLDVAAVGLTLIEQDPALSRIFHECPLFSQNPNLLPFLLALHDVGKYTATFQEKIQDNVKNGAEHTSPGRTILITSLREGTLADYLTHLVSNKKESRNWNSFLKLCVDAVTGHHGKPAQSGAYVRRQDQHVAESWIKELLDFFQPLSLPYVRVEDEQGKYLSWILAGLCVLSDWLASDPAHFPMCDVPIPLDQYWSSAKERAGSLVASTCLLPPKPSEFPATTRDLFGFDPRPLQEEIERLPVSSGPSLTILEESTGGGKTEAALLLAYKLIRQGAGNGIYFALPTMATANAMYDRITAEGDDGRCLYERYYSGDSQVSIMLAHGQKVLSDRYRTLTLPDVTAPDKTWIYDTTKKCLLASVGVGTIDQALMGVLPWKHQSLRLLGVSRNVLIVDEVHAYDSYMNRLLELLLEFQFRCGGSTILLSATLPAKLKKRFIDTYGGEQVREFVGDPYPALTRRVHSDTEVREIPPSPDKTTNIRLVHSEGEVVSGLIQVARGGGCACWIRNTVTDAMDAYRLLQKECPDLHVLLFHARFTMGDRLTREREVLSLFGKLSLPEVRAGCILVATQVVEQSLDLDFDMMVSDLAPIDLIIQRAGRVWRHIRTRPGCVTRPELWILSPIPVDSADERWYSSMFPGGSYVYPEPGKLWKTVRIFQREGKLSMPSDARRLIDEVYSSDDAEIPDALRELDKNEEDKSHLSSGKAVRRALILRNGYTSGDLHWTSDEPTLTRDSEEEQVVLEMWRDGDLWNAGEDFPMMRSQVRIRQRMLPAGLKIPEDHVLPVRFHQEGEIWVCDEIPVIMYSSDTGLSVLRDG